MPRRPAIALVFIALAFAAWRTELAAQQAASQLPEGVTPARIAEGAKLFKGPGLCFACHGPEGKGAAGPDLTDTLWVQSNGTFSEIVQQIVSGVPQNRSKSGVMMPPRGGSSLNDEQVKAVAAYVWRLSHPTTPSR
ncbi:MAG TPA: c-type cytochrome [Gemmatimonadales bacterium]|jgi:mono/diheme cytochrome c family protein